jgi:hypothetical protein
MRLRAIRLGVFVVALCVGSCGGGVDVGQLGGTYQGALQRRTCSVLHESFPATVVIDGSPAPGGSSAQPLFALLLTLSQDQTSCALPTSTSGGETAQLVPGYTCPTAFDSHFQTAEPLSTGDNGSQSSALSRTGNLLDVVIAAAPVCCMSPCPGGDTAEWVEFDGGASK